MPSNHKDDASSGAAVDSSHSTGIGERIDIQRIADRVPALIAYVDEEGRYCYANRHFQAWFGLDEKEILGKTIQEVVGDESYEPIRSNIETALAGTAVGFVHRLSTAAHGPCWLTSRAFPHRTDDGSVRGLFTVACDITDGKRVEEKLRWSEERYRALVNAILETSIEGIITMDESGTVEAINPAALQMFGYSEDEVRGRNVSMLMPSPYREEHNSYIARYLATGEAKVIGSGREVVGRRKDGSVFPLEISVSEANWDDHRVFAGIARDITERKRLEEEFRQAQKMEAVGRLAGGIAHDFNNILMGIIGCCRVAISELPDTHPSRALIEDISAEAERGVGLTRQLLTFSRKRRIAPKAIELNAVVEGAQRMIRHLIGEDIALHVDLTTSGGPIIADPAQIEQVLLNLVVNARDAMPSGGELLMATTDVELTADADQPHGEVPPGSYVALVVRDTGIGMDRTTQAKVFEPFFTTKGAGEGTGLGLSTAYGIVKKLSGHIGLESEPGQGTTFTIWLPRNHGAMPAEPADSGRREAMSGGPETILVVEDEALIRASIRYSLHKLGYVVLEAKDADDALEVCHAHPGRIDVLLSDIVLPGLSGPELAQEIQALKPDIAVLYMSAYPHENLVEQGRLQLDEPSLEKPFTEEVLAARIRGVLDRAPKG